MGLLDGTLQQKILRLEKLTSPSQYPKPSQDSIDKLRNNIKGLSKATPKKKPPKPKAPKSPGRKLPAKKGPAKQAPAKRIKKSDLKKRYA